MLGLAVLRAAERTPALRLVALRPIVLRLSVLAPVALTAVVLGLPYSSPSR